jgi:fructose-specific phosphotransferase system IIA component
VKLSKLMSKDLISLELKAKEKEDAIQEMVDLISKSNSITDKREVLNTILEREKKGTTGIGDGVAVPHGRTKGAKRIVVAFSRSRDGVNFEAMDGKAVHLIFMVIAPEEEEEGYLKLMAQIAHILNKPQNRKSLLEAKNEGEVIKRIKEMETHHSRILK